jgi:hypothetical protein
MNIRPLILSGALALGALSPAIAQELKPVQAQSVELGNASGVAYYTVEPGGLRVVVTLVQENEASPVRVETLLGPDQSVVLSTPRGPGAAPELVEFRRSENALVIRKAPAVAIN